MDTYHVVLYVHLIALFIGIGAGSVLLVCLFHLRAAQTLADAVPWGALAGNTEKAFPIAVLGLFGSGAYMTSDVWTWSTGWIDVSIAGLAILAVQGPLVGGRAGHKLKEALHANGPGALGPEARRMTRHMGLWGTEFANLGLVFAIVWDMTQKPSTAISIVACVVGYGVGIALAYAFSQGGARATAPAVETAS